MKHYISHLGLWDDTEGYSFACCPEKEDALQVAKPCALHLGPSGPADSVVLEMSSDLMWHQRQCSIREYQYSTLEY